MKLLSTLFISIALLFSVNVTAQKCKKDGKSDKRLINTDLSETPVALEGYDILSYFNGKPAKGNASISSVHNTITYLFISQENKQKFDANPEKYLPEFGGFCAVAAAFGKVEELQHYDIYKIVDRKLYLNKNKKAEAVWDKNPNKIIKKANKNWNCLVEELGTSKSGQYKQPTEGIK